MSWFSHERIRLLGLVAGPILALMTLVSLPSIYTDIAGNQVELGFAARATIGVMVWMATWWLTEAVDIPATALLPIVAFPLLGVLDIRQATAPYGSDLIFLFMGGFILALAMQRWGFDRRIALFALRLVGSRPANIIGGFMLVTALISMWVSNTATTAMMLPIAQSVVTLVLAEQQRATGAAGATGSGQNFALSLMLGIAYASSIGGIATIIGSPPNGILVQYVALEYGREISFAEWFLIGGPVTLCFLPIAWAMITWVLYPIRIRAIAGGRTLFETEFRKLGPMNRGEWATLVVFLMTAGLWISRPLLSGVVLGDDWQPLAGLSDGGIAIFAALCLFMIPTGSSIPVPATTVAGDDADPAPLDKRRFVMDWATAVRLPWGILILFGGGLSLAAAVQTTGVAEFIGAQAAVLQGMPSLVLVLAITTAVLFLTELTSNAATTATLLPILGGLAAGLAVTPELLLIPATIAASCAFMMPVGTPPNAIVFGSGHVTIPQMARAGIWLNLIGIVLVTTLLYLIVIPLLGAG